MSGRRSTRYIRPTRTNALYANYLISKRLIIHLLTEHLARWSPIVATQIFINVWSCYTRHNHNSVMFTISVDREGGGTGSTCLSVKNIRILPPYKARSSQTEEYADFVPPLTSCLRVWRSLQTKSRESVVSQWRLDRVLHASSQGKLSWKQTLQRIFLFISNIIVNFIRKRVGNRQVILVSYWQLLVTDR